MFLYIKTEIFVVVARLLHVNTRIRQKVGRVEMVIKVYRHHESLENTYFTFGSLSEVGKMRLVADTSVEDDDQNSSAQSSTLVLQETM